LVKFEEEDKSNIARIDKALNMFKPKSDSELGATPTIGDDKATSLASAAKIVYSNEEINKMAAEMFNVPLSQND
jgi:hypothetical protein